MTIADAELTREQLSTILDSMDKMKPTVTNVHLSKLTITDLWRKPTSTEEYVADFELAKQAVMEVLPIELNANTKKPVFDFDYTVNTLDDDLDE